MRTSSVVLNDSQVAMFTERGTAFQLTLMQEEMVSADGQIVSPAKSFTVSRKDAAVTLRDMLNKAIETSETLLHESEEHINEPTNSN